MGGCNILEGVALWGCMAKIEMGILGGFSGRVGTVVGYCRRGRWFVRAYRPHIRDRRSEAQLQQRSRFKAMIQFASPATPVLRVGFRRRAQALGLTEGNVFLRVNHGRFRGENGGDRDDRNNRNNIIDYGGLRFSEGRLAGLCGVRWAVDERGAMTVRWMSEGGGRHDRVHLYVYCAASGRGVAAEGERGRGRARFLLPQEFVCGELHVWAFAEGRTGEVSATAYGLEESGEEGLSGGAGISGGTGGTGDTGLSDGVGGDVCTFFDG